MRELWCVNQADTIADLAVIEYFALGFGPKSDSSTGLGQIFANTAIVANNNAINKGLITGRIYSTSVFNDRKDMWYGLYNNDEFNIKMVTLELIDCARKKGYINNMFYYTTNQNKGLLARYNGTGDSATQYGEECYDYYLIFEQYK